MDTLYTVTIETKKVNYIFNDVDKILDGDRYIAIFIKDGSQRWFAHNQVISVRVVEQECDENE